MTTERPDWIPSDAEKVGDVWVWTYDDGSVAFEEPGGVDGYLDEDGLTLEVEAGERGRDYEGDCARSRNVPADVLLRVIELFNEARDATP